MTRFLFLILIGFSATVIPNGVAESAPLKRTVSKYYCTSLVERPRAAIGKFDEYQSDTLKSLEVMRNPKTGLVRDKIRIRSTNDGTKRIEVLNNNTSATNIGLDILNLISSSEDPLVASQSVRNLKRILFSLNKMEIHEESGLFFSWYSTDAGVKALVKDVSSVDNIHLALALWTLTRTYPKSTLGSMAEQLFKRMDFSTFYDAHEGLFKGNLKYTAGKWEAESYHFSNFGSEARTIYAITWALGLLRRTPAADFVRKSVDALTLEVFPWKENSITRPILRTWDGGAFQLLLPKLLMNEESLSPELARTFQNFSRYTRKEGSRLGYPVPAAYSASNFGVEGESYFAGIPDYVGKSGNLDLVSTSHAEANDPVHRELWSSVFTPHAAFMAATADPREFVDVFKSMEKLGTRNASLYVQGFGFMDGYHVKGPYAGEVVPVELSLNQGMIALAISQMKAKGNLSPSARALRDDPRVFHRLQDFYRAVDGKMKKVQDGLAEF